MRKLYILTDNESKFLISIPDRKNYRSMDIEKIAGIFRANGFEVSVLKFRELDPSADYSECYFIYQTSEAQGSFYKRYIEDLVYFLEKQGAIMLPRFEYLKAHHNKVYMEMLRSGFKDISLKTIKSFYYGSWQEAETYTGPFPAVVKTASGAGSSGVFLARNNDELKRCVRKGGRVILADSLSALFSGAIKKCVRKIQVFLHPELRQVIKFSEQKLSKSLVIQTFIGGLDGDYKVLVFGNKFYSLYRRNRTGDFRASGSGKLFPVPDNEQKGILDFASKLAAEIDFPVIGVDIAFDGNNYHLLEFQMIHIGPYTLQASDHWYQKENDEWKRYQGTSVLEQEFADSLIGFINKKK